MRYIFIFLMILTACNPPRVRRTANTDDNIITGDSPIIIGNGTSGDEDDSSDSSDNSETKNCTFATTSSSTYKHSSTYFGKFNICRGATSTDTIYLQLANSFSSSAKLCLVPVAKFGSGYIEIGEARCVASSDPLKVYEIPIYFNKTGYDFEGIMILKDSYYQYDYPYGNYYSNGATYLAPDAFLICSNALRQNNNYAYCNAFYKNAHHLITFN